jgi:hypothetical protein
VGDDNVVKSGRGYTCIGDRVKCYGACLTVVGNDVYVEGSDCLVKGTGITVSGPRHYTVGKRIVTVEADTPHALAARPDDAPTPLAGVPRVTKAWRRTTHRAQRDMPISMIVRDPLTGVTSMNLAMVPGAIAQVTGNVYFE